MKQQWFTHNKFFHGYKVGNRVFVSIGKIDARLLMKTVTSQRRNVA